MKYLLGSKKDGTRTFEKFVIRRIDEENEKEIENVIDEGQEKIKKGSLPSWLTSGAAILFGLGVFIFLKSIPDFKQAYANAAWLIYLGAALIIFAIVVYAIYFYKSKKLKENPELKKISEDIDQKFDEARVELNIPAEAIKMDVLYGMVKEKNGIEKLDRIAVFNLINLDNYVFVEDGNLCISDYREVFAFPLDSIKRSEVVTKKIMLPYWNKDEGIKTEKYHQFNVKINNYGIVVKPYFKVTFLIDNEEYYLYVPNYEMEAFDKLVNLNK